MLCYSVPDFCSDSNTPPKKSMNAFKSDRPSSCAFGDDRREGGRVEGGRVKGGRIEGKDAREGQKGVVRGDVDKIEI